MNGNNVAEPNRDIQRIWAHLEEGLVQIYDHESRVAVPRYMGLYTEVFNFCTRQNPDELSLDARPMGRTAPHPPQQNRGGGSADFIGADLYDRLKDFIRKHVAVKAEELDGLHGEDLLEKYTLLWTQFQFSSTVVNGIFSYLNRHWIRREIDEGKNHVHEVYNLAVTIWTEILFSRLHNAITSALLKLIHQERNGEKITTKHLSCVIASYMELGCTEVVERPSQPNQATRPPDAKQVIYKRHFEVPFLEATKEYYAEESTTFVQRHSVTEYLKKVEQRLKEERDRCMLYLSPSTLEPLIKKCHDVLIRQLLPIFQSEFELLLANERDEDLARMFSLCEHVDGALEQLRIILETHIEKKGRQSLEIIAQIALTEPKQYVNAILGVHRRYSELVAKAFRGDAGFVQAMDKALTAFVNRNHVTDLAKSTSKSPELLARYCDLLLRKNARNPEDRELEELLSQVIVVFKYIIDKDVFQKFYSKMLAKRLVTEGSASDEGESNMIGKLKQMCGFEYTSKLQRMFTDANLSKEITDQFRKSPSNLAGIDMSVMVLTSGVWPMTQAVPFKIPKELDSSIEQFTAYYHTRHTGRRLNFLLNHCRGELVGLSLPRRYTFVATVAQMSVLMLFNAALQYTVDQLIEILEMRREFLNSSLHSLIKGDLLIASDDLDVAGCSVTLNEKFTNRKLKVDFSKVILKTEVKKESDEVHKSVEDDRRLVVQAAIVRIMKMRKTLKHAQLVSEVLSQLTPRFSPKIPMIKKSIDLLIEKEYLKRSEDDYESLEYIA